MFFFSCAVFCIVMLVQYSTNEKKKTRIHDLEWVHLNGWQKKNEKKKILKKTHKEFKNSIGKNTFKNFTQFYMGIKWKKKSDAHIIRNCKLKIHKWWYEFNWFSFSLINKWKMYIIDCLWLHAWKIKKKLYKLLVFNIMYVLCCTRLIYV